MKIIITENQLRLIKEAVGVPEGILKAGEELYEIVLKNKPSISRKLENELFVQCNQLECQYVDLNQSPCPLRLVLFAEEIERRAKKSVVRQE